MSSLLVGMAAIDHSGRLRDRALLAALGWQAGDRLVVQVYQTMAVLRRDADGAYRVDSRGQVFLPAAVRGMLGIDTGDRVVLVASPRSGMLIVHPGGVVAALLADYYASVGGLDVG